MAATTDAMMLRIAAGTGGVCTRTELLRAGVPARTITARVDAGFLRRSGPGLYEIPALVTYRTLFHRAALAYPDGVLSHRAAARLWDLQVPPLQPGEPIDVTRPRSASDRIAVPGVRLHTTRRWSTADTTSVDPGLPVTSQARTVVDLAGTDIGDHRLRHVVQTALTTGVLDIRDLCDRLRQVGGRGVGGSGRLHRLLDDIDQEQALPQSELEWRLAELVGEPFRRQYRPPWYDGARGIVDLADPTSRVIVEADGRRWHATEQAMVEDRRRDRQAAANGWLVLRVMWDDVVRRPSETAAQIAAAVAQRSQTSAA